MRRRKIILSMAGLAVTIEVAALIHQFLTPANVDFGWSFRGFVIGPVLTFVGIGTAICFSIWLRAPGVSP